MGTGVFKDSIKISFAAPATPPAGATSPKQNKILYTSPSAKIAGIFLTSSKK
jgi:hypothetical protein